VWPTLPQRRSRDSAGIPAAATSPQEGCSAHSTNRFIRLSLIGRKSLPLPGFSFVVRQRSVAAARVRSRRQFLRQARPASNPKRRTTWCCGSPHLELNVEGGLVSSLASATCSPPTTGSILRNTSLGAISGWTPWSLRRAPVRRRPRTIDRSPTGEPIACRIVTTEDSRRVPAAGASELVHAVLRDLRSTPRPEQIARLTDLTPHSRFDDARNATPRGLPRPPPSRILFSPALAQHATSIASTRCSSRSKKNFSTDHRPSRISTATT